MHSGDYRESHITPNHLTDLQSLRHRHNFNFCQLDRPNQANDFTPLAAYSDHLVFVSTLNTHPVLIPGDEYLHPRLLALHPSGDQSARGPDRASAVRPQPAHRPHCIGHTPALILPAGSRSDVQDRPHILGCDFASAVAQMVRQALGVWVAREPSVLLLRRDRPQRKRPVFDA